MGSVKDFHEFCQTHGLKDEKSISVEAYRRDRRGLPWGQESGGECPECGRGCVKINGARWYCFYCESGGKLDAEPLTPEQQAAERELRKEEQARKRARALKIWNEDCVPITSTNATVSTYFPARGLSLERIPDLDGVMRWHPRCPFGRDKLPCIVSLFRDAVSDEPTAIHRTHILSASRGEAERMALGPFFGSAIKLWPLTSDQESLTVGEGIESVLSALALEVGTPPAWAATVAGNLSRIPVIPGVKRLIIAADNDAHKKGQEHAQILRRKWRDRGREVLAKIPKEVGKDFNDVLRGRS